MRALVWAMVFSGPAWAMGPLEKNHPLVDEGMAAFERGDYESALLKFEAAQKLLPHNATVEFNRGATLHKLSRNDDALQALNQALALDKKELAGKIRYNLGNVLAALEKKKEAVAEYRKALRFDPKDAMARHNLEVLLRDLPPKQDPAPDGGTPDGGKSDGGNPDAGPDGGQQDAGRDGGPTDGGSDGGSDGGGAGDGGADGGRDGGNGDGGPSEGDKPADAGSQGQAGDGGADGGGGDLDAGARFDQGDDLKDGGLGMSKADAEKLLDSMKSSEKNLQLWRFQQKRTKKSHGKDW